MAVIRYKVIEVTKEFDGSTCEVLAEVISVHNNFMSGVFTFSAKKELKKDEEFQQTKEINIVYGR